MSGSDPAGAAADAPYVILVGVSGTSRSPAALRWAVGEAARRGGGARVVAVRAWHPLAPLAGARGTPSMVTPDAPAAEDAARDALVRDVEEVLGPGHGVEALLVGKGRAKALLTEAEALGAAMIVIEAPPRTDLSTAPWFVDRLLHQAPCPVVVLPPRVARPEATPVVRAIMAVAEGAARAAAVAGRPGIRPPPLSHDDGDGGGEGGAAPPG